MKKKIPQKIDRVLIVYKKSSYEEHALDEKDENFLKLLKQKHPAIHRSKKTHDTHIDTLETVKSHLKQLKIPFDICHRYELKPIRDYDLVFTIGGDGTFLETSHFLEKGLMMGINSVPQESVGYFCHATADNFLEKVYQYLEGNCPTQTLHRLVVSIDDKILWPLALNDVLFANTNPAGTTRYFLKIGRLHEEQKSSGIWISPAPGSTAATKSAGGKKLPLDSTDIQYVIREPYTPPGKKYQLMSGILSHKQKIEIYSHMDDALLFIDGPHVSYPVRRGARIVLQNAHQPIRALW